MDLKNKNKKFIAIDIPFKTSEMKVNKYGLPSGITPAKLLRVKQERLKKEYMVGHYHNYRVLKKKWESFEKVMNKNPKEARKILQSSQIHELGFDVPINGVKRGRKQYRTYKLGSVNKKVKNLAGGLDKFSEEDKKYMGIKSSSNKQNKGSKRGGRPKGKGNTSPSSKTQESQKTRGQRGKDKQPRKKRPKNTNGMKKGVKRGKYKPRDPNKKPSKTRGKDKAKRKQRSDKGKTRKPITNRKKPTKSDKPRKTRSDKGKPRGLRKTRSDKGKPRGPRLVPDTMSLPSMETQQKQVEQQQERVEPQFDYAGDIINWWDLTPEQRAEIRKEKPMYDAWGYNTDYDREIEELNNPYEDERDNYNDYDYDWDRIHQFEAWINSVSNPRGTKSFKTALIDAYKSIPDKVMNYMEWAGIDFDYYGIVL